jgi:excisionase family DNA binding protein
MDDQSVVAMPARHFTVQSLAAYWGVSPSHIYNLIHSNALRHMRIGKAIRIPQLIVKEFEEQASCLTKPIFTASGSTTMALGTSYGHQKMERKHREEQSAYLRGQQTAKKPSNSAPNTSQD